LRPDQPRAGGRKVLLGVEDVERRALACLRFLLHAGERDAARTSASAAASATFAPS
jgi:hypothetical protein